MRCIFPYSVSADHDAHILLFSSSVLPRYRRDFAGGRRASGQLSPTLSRDCLQARQIIDADFDFVSRFFVAQLVPHLSLNVLKQAHDAVDPDLVAHCPIIKFAVLQIIPLLNSADAPTQVVNAADADAVRLQGELRRHQQQQNSGQVGE
jgi:hypothetical protein